MLANTTTPDGYKVGADGAWIQGETIPTDTSDYYESTSSFRVKIIDDKIYYRGTNYDNAIFYNNLKCANLDGSNERIVVPKLTSAIIGVDNKIYYVFAYEGTFKRCNLDGSGEELLYQKPSNEGYIAEIEFANSDGIQFSYAGFYNIATGQYNAEQKEDRQADYTRSEVVPTQIMQALPSKDFDSSTYYKFRASKDYSIVLTYDYNRYGSWMSPYELIGEYVVNNKTNTCVAYREGSLGNTITNPITNLYQTDLGLLAEKSDGIYRVEDSGNFVRLMDSIDCFAVKNGKIYYYNSLESKLHIIDNIAPAALPTSRVN